jgi:glycosyltransferase involved in cell wall biosynthesis
VKPSATVIIPCFNYGRFVADAVRSAIAQQNADTRVVIVNDGSTDRRSARQCDACRGPRVRVIHQENRGLPAARNRGAAEAHTEFLAFLDADDTLEPGFVSELAAAIAASEESVSHAYCQEFLSGRRTGTWRVPDWDPLLMLITNLHPVTTLVRRDRFEAVGGFDETMSEGYEDWDFWLKFVERGWRGVRIQKPLCTWRRHSERTMIAAAVERHESLYRRIIANHAPLFERRGDEALLAMNVLLRRHDMNWLDESLEPIPLVKLKAQRDRYEAMPAVRLHHALHRIIDALPSPMASTARAGLRTIKNTLRG